MSARPLPVAFEDITPQWLTAALRPKAPDATVRGVAIVDMIRATCTKIRLRLDLDEAARRAGIPELVILKGGFEPHSRQLGSLGAMHEREVRGYRDVLSRVSLPSPACFFADYDPERQQGIIIMEDLVTRGVTFCHALKPQTFEQVARRLTALARFHAGTWANSGSPDFAPAGKWGGLDDFLFACKPFFDVKTAPDNWARFVGLPRGAASSVRFHDRAWIVDAFGRMMRYARTLPHCVLHGDTHLGNLYIEPDGTPGFLDTLASRGPAMLEISYHVSCALDVADRARLEAALVQHYLDELARNGVDAPPFDDAMRQYGIFLLYGYFIWMTTESNYQTEAVNAANAARVSAAMIDHDIMRLIGTIGE